MTERPTNEPTTEQRLTSLSNKAHGIADKLEDMSNWNGVWEPPEEGRKSGTSAFDLTVKEIEAIRRACKSKALDHYNKRGFSPSYMKYNFLYQKFGGSELEWHKEDPKYLKLKKEQENNA